MQKRLSVVILHYEIDDSDKECLRKTIESFDGQYDELIIADEKTDHVTKKINTALKLATGDFVIMCGNDNEKLQGNLRDLCVPGEVQTAMVDPHRDIVLMTMTCFPKDVLEKVGYFDEQYQCYSADEDILMKLKVVNIPVSCNNKVIIRHNVGGRTTSRLEGYRDIAIADGIKFKNKWQKSVSSPQA